MTYKHKYVTGSNYAFYNNSDTLEDDANFNYWRFDLVHSDTFIPVIEDVTVLAKDIISGTDYRWYADSFVFPQVDTGCYKFVIVDTSTNDRVMYISDEIEVVNSDDGLTYVKYRNAVNILNYNYTGLPSFYNLVHMEAFKRKPLRPLTTEGYVLSSGSFKRIRSIYTKTFEFITGWFDEKEHDAMQSIIIHSDLQMLLDGNLEAMELPEDGEYALEWPENYEFVEASVRLQQANRSSSNKAV